jgi:tetratricopeptide (TPR) repeat protein
MRLGGWIRLTTSHKDSMMIGQTLGRYRIQDKLGEGGMGEVFLARDTALEREVAIKMLPAALSADPIARERFRREALAAAGLDHPFICKVFEIGDADGRLFIVMEFVAGETLHDSLRRGPLPSGDLLALALELTDALEAAHTHNIVHRDLKPANIMLTSQRHVKVMDFGLAKIVPDASAATCLGAAAPITEQGARVGTPAYMSPEQVAGDAVDQRSDIFSLGVLLVEAVTGVHPFVRDTLAGTMAAVLNDPPLVHASVSVGEMQLSLRSVLLRMLTKSPGARYQSIGEVRSDLQSIGLPRPDADNGGRSTATAGDMTSRKQRWPMVGRDGERAELMRHLDGALAGHGGVVLIGGEPGIGKTRLTEELLADARGRGAMGCVGHCYEMQGSPPYVPFVEITEYAARVVPPAALRRLLGDDAPEVARLMPELRRMFADIPQPVELPAEQQRWYFFNAFRAFVERATRLAPLVAVFEDLHWADEPTLHLLLHLAQSVASTSLLIIGTYRDVELEVTRPFAKVLESLLRQRLATRMALRRLPASGVDALLEAMSGRPAPASFARVVFHETEGNPFFVEEVFQHLAEEGRLFTSDGNWRSDLHVDTLNVPEGVRLVIGRRLERLSETARRVLTTGAVLGRTFSLALLEELESGPGGAGPDAMLDAIEEAERAHLVTPHGNGRDAQYMFGHELIRQTLADALSMPRRQRLHGRIALAIETLHASQLAKHVSMLAHHFYQAGAAADVEKTTDYLVQAADQAHATAAHEEAFGYLEHARSLWEGDRSDRMADLLDRRAAALDSLGRTREAIDAAREAAVLWHELERNDRYAASMCAVCTRLAWVMDMDASIVEADRALSVLQAAPVSLRAPLQYLHALALANRGDVAEALEELAEADAVCMPLTDPYVRAHGTQSASIVNFCAMRMARGSECQRQTWEAMTALGRPWEAMNMAYVLVLAELHHGRLREVAVLLDDLEPRAERMGHRQALWAFRSVRQALRHAAGDLAGAERETREVIEFARVYAINWGYLSELRLGDNLFVQGKTEEALETLRRLAAFEPPSRYRQHSRGVLFRCLSYVEPDAAREYLRDTGIPLPTARAVNAYGDWFNLMSVVEGLYVLGDHDAVAKLMPLTEMFAASEITMMTIAALPRAAAGIAAACAGAWDAAEMHFREGLALCDNTPVRIGQGQTREWYADMLMIRNAGDDRARAATLYAEAAENYETIGLVFYASRLAEKRARLNLA